MLGTVAGAIFGTTLGRIAAVAVLAWGLWSYVTNLIEDRAVAETKLETAVEITEATHENIEVAQDINAETAKTEQEAAQKIADLEAFIRKLQNERAQKPVATDKRCLDSDAVDRLQQLRNLSTKKR